jgi:hypothetical protein
VDFSERLWQAPCRPDRARATATTGSGVRNRVNLAAHGELLTTCPCVDDEDVRLDVSNLPDDVEPRIDHPVEYEAPR